MHCLYRLSGLSPFAGDNDIETLKNVKACDWDFDEEAFRDVSEEGKDFIRRLLIKNKEYDLCCILYTENFSKIFLSFARVLVFQEAHDSARVSSSSVVDRRP